MKRANKDSRLAEKVMLSATGRNGGKKMKMFTIILIHIMLIFSFSFADIVKTKANTYEGEILSETNSTIEMRLLNGVRLFINKEDILSIENEKYQSKNQPINPEMIGLAGKKL